ncbi:MAG: DUF488 domain-containing protein, partial [Euryarchaeota archaeon]|nr:DUF488 domain-containing protein [Euryarchaeota archaeon]
MDHGGHDWTGGDDGRPRIRSIGHSDHETDAFFALLAAHGTATLVDVRTHPKSHHERFSKKHLAPTCRDRGVTYHHLPGLGGKREGTYRAHMESAEWKADYARLKAIALAALHQGHTAAFLCVERDPGDCHRRYIAERL